MLELEKLTMVISEITAKEFKMFSQTVRPLVIIRERAD